VLGTQPQDEFYRAILRRLRFSSAVPALIVLGVKSGPSHPAESENAPANQAPDAQGADSGRVLLAEDHPLNRKLVKLILTTASVSLTCAHDGAEAIEAFRDCRYDAVLMDLQMPRVGGLEAIAAMREMERAEGRPRTPILALTADDRDPRIDAALAAGADGHLAKPIVPARLLAWIDAALSNPPQVETTAPPARTVG
jgi:two-component system, sensor histidine kinase